MFDKILIANRGEIACRVAATARRLGIRSVAVYSDADAQAAHVMACDEAVHIGGSAPRDSYLQWERIIAAAQATGAQAVHPGYGFLSENEAFAQACSAAGLAFIGPPASAILAMGLKAESKQLMEQAGVPLVPGYHGRHQDPALLRAEAERIGYPVLIKASAGGGGKGMRAVERDADFDEALRSCQREALNSFGDAAVLIEKYVQRPRHIEIQIFTDTHGNGVYLFERDCSVQRRHQKVLEEAPAPWMSPELRTQMGLAAVAAARAVDYVGAGTVEFIVEGLDGAGGTPRFYFMEMNTRLQVEHPVTEAITGQDLVEWQLRVAAGEPLPLAQEDLCIQGHAIEARVCAESPDKQFLPAVGQLQVYRRPSCVSFGRGDVRVDDGVCEGDAISPFYDSMIAKLIVHGDTREQALARLDQALARMHIVGVANNVQFLRHVVASPSFAQAQLDTGLIPREAAVLFGQDRIGCHRAVLAATASVLQAERAQPVSDPWAQRDAWCSHGLSQRRWEWSYGDHRRVVVELHRLRSGEERLVLIEGDQRVEWPWSFRAAAPSTGWALDIQGPEGRDRATVYWHGDEAHVFMPRGATTIRRLDPLGLVADDGREEGRLTAPMPGKVVSFAVGVGERVSKGQVLAVMEAMKMEHTIMAPQEGEVRELLYAPGDQVAEGAELLQLSPL